MRKKCKICHKWFSTEYKTKKYCSVKCSDDAGKLRGIARQWSSIKSIVLNRDNNKCVSCGSTCNLVAHHIKFLIDGGDNNLNNLVTLCKKCHGKAHN